MPVNSKAQTKATTKYVRENYDRILVKMPKGRRDIVKAHASALGENTNSFINRLLCEACGIVPEPSENKAGEGA